jgi:hypothetical protein
MIRIERADRHWYVRRRLPINGCRRFGDGEARTSLKGERANWTDEQDREEKAKLQGATPSAMGSELASHSDCARAKEDGRVHGYLQRHNIRHPRGEQSALCKSCVSQLLTIDEATLDESADLPRTRDLVEAQKGRWRRIMRTPRSFNACVSSRETPHQRDRDGSGCNTDVGCLGSQAFAFTELQSREDPG